MNINDMHYSLGHANDAALRETAKQLHLKLTGHRQYCSGCGEAKAIRATVHKTTSFRAVRPFERPFGDLTGPFSPSAGWYAVLYSVGERLQQRGVGAVSEGYDRQHCHPGFSRLLCRHQAADRCPRAGGKSPYG